MMLITRSKKIVRIPARDAILYSANIGKQSLSISGERWILVRSKPVIIAGIYFALIHNER